MSNQGLGYGSEYEHVFGNKSDFLKFFVFNRKRIRFSEDIFYKLDASISMNAALESSKLERFLIKQNEAFTTRSTAVAEGTNETTEDKTTELIGKIDKNENPVSGASNKERYDELELASIIKTFRHINATKIDIDNLSVETLKELHVSLTDGLDKIGAKLNGFTPYYSGQLRKSDSVRVGEYQPVQHLKIRREMDAAFDYIKGNKSITDIFLFSLAVYAIHPFHNGNKRVCRMLEHALLKSSGLNKGNMYSHITELYADLDKFYRQLKIGLENRFCDPYVAGQMSALMRGQLNTLTTTIEFLRQEHLDKKLAGVERKHLSEIAGLFVKNKTLRFKDIRGLYRINDKQIAEALAGLTSRDILNKKKQGKETLYFLKFSPPVEKETLKLYLECASQTDFNADNCEKTLRGQIRTQTR